jgi:biopolymer transport protein ExbB/TolQ
MEMNQVIAISVSSSIWEIIKSSSAFGIFILLVLVTMSLVSWAIIFSKWREFKAVEVENDKFLKTFRRARSLGEATGQAKSHTAAPVSHIFLAGHKSRISSSPATTSFPSCFTLRMRAADCRRPVGSWTATIWK